MKVVLVRPGGEYIPWTMPPSLGLYYISAAVKKAGHECTVYDALLHYDTPEQTYNNIPHDADIIGIQMFYTSVEWVKEFIRYIPRNSSNKVIIGGPHVTVSDDSLRKEVNADVGVQGEFDNSLDVMLPKILNDGITGTFRMPSTDLNVMPFPDYDEMNLPAYWKSFTSLAMPVKGKRIGYIQCTRGCFAACTFCANGKISNYKVKYREIDNIVEEVKYLKSRYNIDELWITDDNVLSNYKYALKLFHEIEKFKLHLRMPSGIRVDNVDDNIVKAMKNAGLYHVGIGIESGNPRVLRRIKKGITLDKAKSAIEILRGNNISVVGLFIVGIPTETYAELNDTLNFALNSKLNHAQFQIFYQVPGSEDADKNSLFTDNELLKLQRKFTFKFYLRPKIIWSAIKYFRPIQLKLFLHHPFVTGWIKGRFWEKDSNETKGKLLWEKNKKGI